MAKHQQHNERFGQLHRQPSPGTDMLIIRTDDGYDTLVCTFNAPASYERPAFVAPPYTWLLWSLDVLASVIDACFAGLPQPR